MLICQWRQHLCPGFDPVSSYTMSQRHSQCHNQPRPDTSAPSLCVLLSSVCQINCPYGACYIRQGGWEAEGIRLLNSHPSQCLKTLVWDGFPPKYRPNQPLNLMEKSEPWVVILMEEDTRGERWVGGRMGGGGVDGGGGVSTVWPKPQGVQDP